MQQNVKKCEGKEVERGARAYQKFTHGGKWQWHPLNGWWEAKNYYYKQIKTKEKRRRRKLPLLNCLY